MNFQELKTEILRRANEKDACESGYVKAENAQTEKEFFDVIKKYFAWCCRNEVLDSELINGNKELFNSRLGRFTTREKEWLKENVATPSGCLHCACAGREGCKLRLYATAAGIKRPRYEASSTLPVMKKIRVTEKMLFELAKCIRCGLCVYNSKNGFTFKDRGFGMQVVIPDENRMNVGEELAELCPTGALKKDF